MLPANPDPYFGLGHRRCSGKRFAWRLQIEKALKTAGFAHFRYGIATFGE
jgi:hypothetical protein